MERLSVMALNQLPTIAARAKAMLETNRKTLNNFFETRDDLDALSTKFGTTSFPRLRAGNGEKLSTLLIEKYETAVAPGRFFESPNHIRVGMCCDPTFFNAGVERLGKALDELRR